MIFLWMLLNRSVVRVIVIIIHFRVWFVVEFLFISFLLVMLGLFVRIGYLNVVYVNIFGVVVEWVDGVKMKFNLDGFVFEGVEVVFEVFLCL